MENLSITRLAGLCKDQGLTKEMLVEHFKELGVISDIRTITEKGMGCGIVYCSNYAGNTWPTYPESVQNYVKAHATELVQKYGYIQLQVEAEKEKRREERKQEKQQKREYLKAADERTGEKKFAYLDIDNFVILDTETTGLSEIDEVVEIGIVDMDGKALYEKRFKPSVPINPQAARVNHMSLDVLKDCPEFTEQDWEEVRNIIGNRKILGHNIPFDARLLQQTYEKHVGRKLETDLFDDMYDSKQIAKTWMKVKSYSLNNLTTDIGIIREEQHSAVDDCRMTLEFLTRLEDVINIKRNYSFVGC